MNISTVPVVRGPPVARPRAIFSARIWAYSRLPTPTPGHRNGPEFSPGLLPPLPKVSNAHRGTVSSTLRTYGLNRVQYGRRSRCAIEEEHSRKHAVTRVRDVVRNAFNPQTEHVHLNGFLRQRVPFVRVCRYASPALARRAVLAQLATLRRFDV